MNSNQLINALESHKMKKLFRELYGANPDQLNYQKKRYEQLIGKYVKTFGNDDLYLFSSPGRTEIGGNHTDHNHGRVLAASINLDAIAVVSVNVKNEVVLFSEGYEKPFYVSLNDFNPSDAEAGTTNALIRGIAGRFRELGYDVGGFRAYITSDVGIGSGLSSSAAIEVLIGTIMNVLYNEGRISAETIAGIGQYAENVFFGKPCGLMDQIACAVGGMVFIDFGNPEMPVVEKVDFDFAAVNYTLLVVETGESHQDLTDEYSAIPSEMKSVAKIVGGKVCRDIELKDLLRNICHLRSQVGDRAILRAIHFLKENERVVKQVKALREGNFERFLDLVGESGDSSYKWLQNCISGRYSREQGIALALGLTDLFLKENGEGVCRVHGGGFAGTIQVFLPERFVKDYMEWMKPVGKDIIPLTLRDVGSICINERI